MKDCKNIHPLLSLHLEGELTQKEETLVQKHLAACITARRELEQFGRMRKALRETPPPRPPADLHARIMGRLGMPDTSPRVIPWKRPFFLAAAMLVVVFFANRYPGWRERTTAYPEQGATHAPADPTDLGKSERASYRVDQEASGTAPQKKNDSRKGKKERKATADAEPVVVKKAAEFAAEPEGMEVRLRSNDAAPDPSVPKEADDAGLMAGGSLGRAEEALPAAPFPGDRDERTSAVAAVPEQPPALTRSLKAATAKPALPVPASGFADLPPSDPDPASGWQGDNGPISGERGELVTRPEAFQLYWLTLMPGQPTPEVDFNTQAVLLLLAGEKPTAGYSVRISHTEEKGGNLVVHYRVEPPPPGTLTAQVVTRPWSMTVIPKPSLPVVFQREN